MGHIHECFIFHCLVIHLFPPIISDHTDDLPARCGWAVTYSIKEITCYYILVRDLGTKRHTHQGHMDTVDYFCWSFMRGVADDAMNQSRSAGWSVRFLLLQRECLMRLSMLVIVDTLMTDRTILLFVAVYTLLCGPSA